MTNADSGRGTSREEGRRRRSSHRLISACNAEPFLGANVSGAQLTLLITSVEHGRRLRDPADPPLKAGCRRRGLARSLFSASLSLRVKRKRCWCPCARVPRSEPGSTRRDQRGRGEPTDGRKRKRRVQASKREPPLPPPRRARARLGLLLTVDTLALPDRAPRRRGGSRAMRSRPLGPEQPWHRRPHS